MATLRGDGLDDEVADLPGQLGQLRVRQLPEVGWLADAVESHHRKRYWSRWVTAQSASVAPGTLRGAAAGRPAVRSAHAPCLRSHRSRRPRHRRQQRYRTRVRAGPAAHGASIAIWGTNPDKNAAAAEELRSTGATVLDLVCDVGDQPAVESSFAATLEALGRVDSCFVNAGVGGRATSFLDMSADEWRRLMRVNLDGAFFSAQAAVRHMVERHRAGDESGGSVVFTTSGSAFFGQARGQHYGASKGG